MSRQLRKLLIAVLLSVSVLSPVHAEGNGEKEGGETTAETTKTEETAESEKTEAPSSSGEEDKKVSAASLRDIEVITAAVT